jgi:hypothetical protein
MCRLSGQEDPIILLSVMVDPTGVASVEKLVLTYTYRYQSRDLKLCTMSFLFGDM